MPKRSLSLRRLSRDSGEETDYLVHIHLRKTRGSIGDLIDLLDFGVSRTIGVNLWSNPSEFAQIQAESPKLIIDSTHESSKGHSNNLWKPNNA